MIGAEHASAVAAAVAEERARGEAERAQLLEDCRTEIKREAADAQASNLELFESQAREQTAVLDRAAEARTTAVKVRLRFKAYCS